MDGLTADMFKSLIGAGPTGILAGVWFYLWRQRGLDLDKRDAKIEALQSEIIGMYKSQLESEPSRRETLSGIARSIEDQSDLLKDRLKP